MRGGKPFWQDLLKQKEKELDQIKRVLSEPARVKNRRIQTLEDEIMLCKSAIEDIEDNEQRKTEEYQNLFVLGLNGEITLRDQRGKK